MLSMRAPEKAAWRNRSGALVKYSFLPCEQHQLARGGTPALDDVNGTISLDAMFDAADGSSPQHLVFGLSTTVRSSPASR